MENKTTETPKVKDQSSKAEQPKETKDQLPKTESKKDQSTKLEQTVPAPIPEKSAWKVNNESAKVEKTESAGKKYN